MTWVKMTIDPVLRSNISHRDVAKDLWDRLKKQIFLRKNRTRIQQIKVELACYKQRGLVIQTYYGKIDEDLG